MRAYRRKPSRLRQRRNHGHVAAQACLNHRRIMGEIAVKLLYHGRISAFWGQTRPRRRSPVSGLSTSHAATKATCFSRGSAPPVSMWQCDATLRRHGQFPSHPRQAAAPRSPAPCQRRRRSCAPPKPRIIVLTPSFSADVISSPVRASSSRADCAPRRHKR